MLPYFQWLSFHLGPVTIQVWGLMVALGFIVGYYFCRYRVKQKSLSASHLDNLVVLIIFFSLLVGRLAHVFLYEPRIFVRDPWEIIKIWDGGMSVFGGFIGALIAAILYLRIKRLDLWFYFDALIFGLPFGYAIGRLGCFFNFDHPGTPTSFFLGQQYLDVVRHNHGLYLSLTGLVMAGIFWGWRKKKLPRHFLTALFAVWYGIVRFTLDFWRAYDLPQADARYFGLTPAQYGSILLVLIGVWLLVSKNKARRLSA